MYWNFAHDLPTAHGDQCNYVLLNLAVLKGKQPRRSKTRLRGVYHPQHRHRHREHGGWSVYRQGWLKTTTSNRLSANGGISHPYWGLQPPRILYGIKGSNCAICRILLLLARTCRVGLFAGNTELRRSPDGADGQLAVYNSNMCHSSSDVDPACLYVLRACWLLSDWVFLHSGMCDRIERVLKSTASVQVCGEPSY